MKRPSPDVQTRHPTSRFIGQLAFESRLHATFPREVRTESRRKLTKFVELIVHDFYEVPAAAVGLKSQRLSAGQKTP